MWKATKWVVTGAILSWASLAMAQTPYEEIEVGTVVKDGIERGTFMKPIPLPEGEWLVVSKRTEDREFTRNNSKFTRPQYFLTLKSARPQESPIYAMVVWFNPDALNMNWGNKKCENQNPKAMIDDFGYNADSMLYLCAVSWSVSGYKDKVATSATSSNNWRQLNLPGLAAYPDDISDDTLEVNLWGNKFKGTAMGYTFLIKRKGDFLSDSAYASYVKDWVHATGLALGETLINNKAVIALPANYPAQ